jgi:hypothetical protein
MAIDGLAAKEVLAHIDRDELAQLGCDLTSIPSPTGHEKAIAEFILAWFEANGLKATGSGNRPRNAGRIPQRRSPAGLSIAHRRDGGSARIVGWEQLGPLAPTRAPRGRPKALQPNLQPGLSVPSSHAA